MPGRRTSALELAQKSWNDDGDFLITLSVRSAFDLLLRALQLPSGSEVLLSALTVPDMVRIVQSHGLVPVPVDTDARGHIDANSLQHAITGNSRMIVVAHLFGGWTPMDDVRQVAQDHGLIVVEDCAQSFCRVGDSAHPSSDVAMFSFGPIKTATALGGAIVRVKSPALRDRMRELLNSDPIQSRTAFLRRIARFSLLKLLSGRIATALTQGCVEGLGGDFDLWANTAVRGFGTSHLAVQLRRQPSAALLKLLAKRWRSYDFARIERRARLGRQLSRCIGHEHPASHTFWVYPIFVSDPIVLRDRLRAAGFDATCQARMTVVPAGDRSRDPTMASTAWKHVLFLPWYPDLPEYAVDIMASVIASTMEETGATQL
ncbi:MAG: DegT/DnrJ/EryC1/StrS family aminotransferase [Pirellulales bacterium]